MQRGWVVRGELGRAMLTSLPALAREAAGWHGPAQCWAAGLGRTGRSPGKLLPLFIFCFLFLFNISATLLN